MDSNRIANILYNMCLDMDYNDYSDFFETEINQIENTIENLKNNDDTLYHVLFTIACDNEDQFDILTSKMR